MEQGHSGLAQYLIRLLRQPGSHARVKSVPSSPLQSAAVAPGSLQQGWHRPFPLVAPGDVVRFVLAEIPFLFVAVPSKYAELGCLRSSREPDLLLTCSRAA